MENLTTLPSITRLTQDNAKLEYLRCLSQLCQAKIKQVAQAYESLHMGKFDNVVYQGLIEEGLSYIESRLVVKINTSCEALKLQSEELRKQALDAGYVLLNRLELTLTQLKEASSAGLDGGDPFPLKLIIISGDGTPVLSAEAEQELRRMSRVYLSSSDKGSLYGNLQTAAKAITTVRDGLRKEGNYEVTHTESPIMAALDLALLELAASSQKGIVKPATDHRPQ